MDNFINWMQNRVNENQEFINFVNSQGGNFDPKTILNQWEKIQNQKKLRPSVPKKNIPSLTNTGSAPVMRRTASTPAPINNPKPKKNSKKASPQLPPSEQVPQSEPQMTQAIPEPVAEPESTYDRVMRKFNLNTQATPNVINQSNTKSVAPYNPSYDHLPTEDDEAENMDIYKNYLQNHSGFGYGTGGGERVTRSSRIG